MRRSLKVGTFAGIDVRIHWTFWLLIIWIVLRDIYLGNSLDSTLWSVLFIGLLFLCVVLHEYGHALTARRFGVNTDQITLLPIGGVASLERIPEDPRQELLVAVAGPLVNVVIAFLLLPFVPIETYMDLPQEELQQALSTINAGNFILYLFSANAILVLFNILPAFPMDGGRVLRALLAMRMNRVQATRIATLVGQFMASVFFFVGLFYNPLLLLIGVFIFFGAQAENQMTEQMSLLHGYLVKDAMITNMTPLEPDDSIQDLVDLVLSTSQKNFVVVRGDQVQGVLYQDNIMQYIQQYSRDTPIEQVMSTDFATTHPDEDLGSLLESIRKHQHSFLPVVANGQLIGSIDMDNLNEFISIRALSR